jgi:hypothetical protein
MSETSSLLVRMPPATKAWLAAQAAFNGRSMTNEINALIKEAMKERPIFAVVRRVNVSDDAVYSASLGDSADDFYEGQSKEEAFAAARGKLKELGFPRARIEFREETINV